MSSKETTRRRLDARQKRKQYGGVLAEGTVGIILILFILQICLFFMVHIWQMCVYKQKIATAASQAAQACADDATNRSFFDAFNSGNSLHHLRQIARAEVLKSLGSLQVPANATSVAVRLDGRLVTVKVTCRQLGVLGVPPMLANLVTIDESSTAPVRIVMPPGIMALTSSSGLSVAVPVYGGSLVKTDFVRPYAQFSAAVPTPVQCQSTTLGTIVDSNWLHWSPVYP